MLDGERERERERENIHRKVVNRHCNKIVSENGNLAKMIFKKRKNSPACAAHEKLQAINQRNCLENR
jgi:predicted transcriptional regulator